MWLWPKGACSPTVSQIGPDFTMEKSMSSIHKDQGLEVFNHVMIELYYLYIVIEDCIVNNKKDESQRGCSNHVHLKLLDIIYSFPIIHYFQN